MARLPRVYVEGILYYVTSQGSNNADVFRDTSDYTEYVALIDRYKKQYGFRLFSYVLLPSHLHLLVELKENIGISSIMHDMNSLYTKRFNERYNKKGHLFQGRFKAVFAEKETHFLQLVRHMHLNPKRLGLVDDPEDYPYSSHCQYVNPAKRIYPDMRNEVEEAFGMLKGREEVFQEYVAGADSKELYDFKKGMGKKRILGSTEFSDQIKKAVHEASRQQARGRKLTRRTRIIYLLVAGTFMLMTAFTIDHFHLRTTTAVQSEYDRTIALYRQALSMLEQKMEDVPATDQDAESYRWKIGLTEKALEDITHERAVTIKSQRALDGYGWNIKLKQTGGSKRPYAANDVIYFKDKRVYSKNLEGSGFPGSGYSKRAKGNITIWETMQINSEGSMANWRGEWNGEFMKGVLKLRDADGSERNFNFKSTGERTAVSGRQLVVEGV